MILEAVPQSLALVIQGCRNCLHDLLVLILLSVTRTLHRSADISSRITDEPMNGVGRHGVQRQDQFGG
jgi:hypothetical protein